MWLVLGKCQVITAHRALLLRLPRGKVVRAVVNEDVEIPVINFT